MSNKDIARMFNRLGKIMELHDENPFKVRSYYSAYNTLRKIEKPLLEMSLEELSEIQGVGKAISDKIIELKNTGELKTFNKYAEMTPSGIIEMLGVRGFGPKKIKVVWNEMGIETIGELLYACNENRLIELKGFGHKTQEQLKSQLQYFIDSQGKYLYGYIEDEALQLLARMKEIFPSQNHNITGSLKMKRPIVESIEIITTVDVDKINSALTELGIELLDGVYKVIDYPVTFYFATEDRMVWEDFLMSSSEEFIDYAEMYPGEYESEEALFEEFDLPYIIPERREDPDVLDEDETTPIKTSDVKGVVHSHSTYSDGIHTVEEMALHAKALGYEYLVMTDHSKAAFYADGLSEDKVFQQFEEIDELNKQWDDFRIFKGIEADILNDGSIDYGNDFLNNFEVVIASVHSNLKMDEPKANRRLITAIENPNTHILGHPTGRLLLSREGYPIDHMKIIDACAENNTIIELNSNPLRLDLDWTWINYAMNKGVKISINPDSHNKESIAYIKYGVYVARKAGLTKEMCLNSLGIEEFEKWVNSLK